MANVNKHTVPSNAIWAQTVIASLFALLAFIVLPSVGVGGQRGLGGVTPPTTQKPGRCLGVSSRGSSRIE